MLDITLENEHIFSYFNHMLTSISSRRYWKLQIS